MYKLVISSREINGMSNQTIRNLAKVELHIQPCVLLKNTMKADNQKLN